MLVGEKGPRTEHLRGAAPSLYPLDHPEGRFVENKSAESLELAMPRDRARFGVANTPGISSRSLRESRDLAEESSTNFIISYQ